MNNGDEFDQIGFKYFLKDNGNKEWKKKYEIVEAADSV